VQNLLRRLLFHYWYFGQPPWDTGVSPPELLDFIQNHEPGRAIDIGCGTGTNVITLANAGWRVTGVDFAPRAIKLATRKVSKAGIQAELLVRDATNLQGIDGPFDLAFDLGCFHGISQTGRAKYLEQLTKILAPGGFWLLYGFLKSDQDQSGTGLAEWDLEQILTRLALVWRRDGVDRRGPSAWFLFQKEESLVGMQP
jgi:cyclopropane fatty-acyl-phospholipid synthase-like methyltransferase